MKVRQTWAYKLCYLVGVIGLLVTLPSCDALDDIIGPTLVTVRLVNTGDFAVDVELYYDNEQLTPEILLTEIGEQLEFTVPAGETRTFSRSCDDLQALMIEDADLNIIGGLGPGDQHRRAARRRRLQLRQHDHLHLLAQRRDLRLRRDVRSRLGPSEPRASARADCPVSSAEAGAREWVPCSSRRVSMKGPTAPTTPGPAVRTSQPGGTVELRSAVVFRTRSTTAWLRQTVPPHAGDPRPVPNTPHGTDFASNNGVV